MWTPAARWLQLFVGLVLSCWCCYRVAWACPVQGVGLDAASKAYLSPIVFQGKLVTVVGHGTLLRATFRVQKILKMDEKKSVLKEKTDVIVEFARNASNSGGRSARRHTTRGGRQSCLGAMLHERDLQTEQRYIVFVSEKRPSTFMAVAVPEPHTRRKAVSKILCTRCAKSPSVKGLGDVKVELQQKLRLKCKLSGNPPPRIAWFKNGTKLKPNERIKVKSKRRFSRLVIKRVAIQDSGLYECRATNVLGNSSAVARVVVTRPILPTTNDSPIWIYQGRPCLFPAYCLNGGTCSLYETVGEYVCMCAEGYRGLRCENKAISTLSMDINQQFWENQSFIPRLIEEDLIKQQIKDAPRAPLDLDATTRMLQHYWGK